MRFHIDQSVTAKEVLAEEVRTGSYRLWSEGNLYAEVARRKLVHGVSVNSFPDLGVRCARLAEMLEGNDKYRDFLRTLVKPVERLESEVRP